MRRETQALVLLLLGGTLMKISFLGTYLRYVKVGLRPGLILAGAVLVGVAVLTLFRLFTADRPGRRAGAAGTDSAGQDCGRRDSSGQGSAGHGSARQDSAGQVSAGQDDGSGHGHGHGWFEVGWLLVLPALALLLVAPPALGSYAAARGGTALGAEQTADFPALPAGDPVRVSVLDYASRAVFDRGRSLGERQVELSGFLIPGPGGNWDLARMVVTCCAADARPIKVGLTGAVPGGLIAGGWLQVTGLYTAQVRKDTVNSASIPYLDVRSALVIPAPTRQYES